MISNGESGSSSVAYRDWRGPRAQKVGQGFMISNNHRMGPPVDRVNHCPISVANKMVDISRTSYWELFHGL